MQKTNRLLTFITVAILSMGSPLVNAETVANSTSAQVLKPVQGVIKSSDLVGVWCYVITAPDNAGYMIIRLNKDNTGDSVLAGNNKAGAAKISQKFTWQLDGKSKILTLNIKEQETITDKGVTKETPNTMQKNEIQLYTVDNKIGGLQISYQNGNKVGFAKLDDATIQKLKADSVLN